MSAGAPRLGRSSRRSRLWWSALALAALLALACEVLIERESHFPMEALFGFSALLAVGAGVLLILVAVVAGMVLRRRDDYYDERDG
jgi:hypothetical protein